MTGMKRRTISIPDELEQAITDLRKTDRFCRCSYAEIIRTLLDAGLKSRESVLHPPKNPAGGV